MNQLKLILYICLDLIKGTSRNFKCILTICSLKFIRLLRVVFSSQQRLNRPAVNAVQ